MSAPGKLRGEVLVQVQPQHRSRAVQIVAFIGLAYAALGFYNANYLHWVDSPWLGMYSDRIAIVVFGAARILAERNAYTRRRLIALVGLVTLLWLALPLFFGVTWFNHHTFGTPWFFIYIVIIFLVGRRADCSWNCPCVGLRDTAAEPFRERTIKGPAAYLLQNFKWLALASALPALYLVTINPAAAWGGAYMRGFWTAHLNLYFASLFIIPVTGSRNYCRYLCPWGSLYGLVGRLGFFRVKADPERCRPCSLCESACDMGVPLRRLIEQHGQVKVADCVGCGRCVEACPNDALKLEDVRDWLRERIAAGRKRP